MNAQTVQKINKDRQDLYPSFAHNIAEILRQAGADVPADFTKFDDPMARIHDVRGVFFFDCADGRTADVYFSVTLHQDNQFYARVLLDDRLEPVGSKVSGADFKRAVWTIINDAYKASWPNNPEYQLIALEGVS